MPMRRCGAKKLCLSFVGDRELKSELGQYNLQIKIQSNLLDRLS